MNYPLFGAFLLLICSACAEPRTREDAEAEIVVTPAAATPKPLWSMKADAMSYKKRHLSLTEYKPGSVKDPVELTGVPPLAAASGAVYAVHDSHLLCLDQKDGKERWKAYVAPLELQVAEWQGHTAVYEETGRLRMFRASDGTLLCPEVQTFPDGIMITDQEVVYLYGDTFLQSYDIRNGRLLWERKYVPGEDIVPHLLSFHAGAGTAVAELYSADKGYKELMALHPRTAYNPWKSIGKMLLLSDRRAYIYKSREQEIWVRNVGNGELVEKDRQLLVRKLELFNGMFFHAEGDDVIYTSDQRFFDPESVEVSKAGMQPKPSSSYVVTEIVRQSLLTGKIQWHIGVEQGPRAMRWTVTGGMLIEAAGDPGPQGDVFHSVKAYRLTDTAPLWQIQSLDGITHFSVHENRLFFTTRDGWLHAYQLNP